MKTIQKNAVAVPREYCGLCGVCGGDIVLEKVHTGLHSLQHRGQEAAGVMLSSEGQCRLHKGAGLVDTVFGTLPAACREGKADRAIGHVRYSTAGGSGAADAQPIMVNIAGRTIGVAHNGTISNSHSLRLELMDQGAIFQTTSDTEIVLHLIARCLKKEGHGKLWDALETALTRLEGAFCLLLLTADEMVAVRDPFGFRPLVIGHYDDGGMVVASETLALDVTGARLLREVEPGEMIVFSKNTHMSSRMFAPSKRRAHCIFEHVYFARPGSYVFGDSVYQVRKAMGRQLAKEAPVEADAIIPMPDSGMFAGLGYAEESGIVFDMGITRNHYVGRTFIDPAAGARQMMATRKLQPIAEALRGKRVCLIEDSIVRGSTCRARVKAIRAAGAREVHMRVSCPPHRFGCYYGIDFPEREKLFANKFEPERFATVLGLDSLKYLSEEGMLSCVRAYKPEDYCVACFNGEYPVPPEMVNLKE